MVDDYGGGEEEEEDASGGSRPGAGIYAIKKRKCFVQEATAKGFRLCLRNYQRACLHSDEAVNVFKTSFADPSVVRHWADKGKLNNYLLSEPDDMSSGVENTHLGYQDLMYVVGFKVTGQAEVVEEVMFPLQHAFQKRMSVAWTPDDLPACEHLSIQASDGLVSSFHRWLFKHVTPVDIGKVVIDGVALDVYNHLRDAVQDWIKVHKGDEEFTKFHRYKLDFFHTDVLRSALLCMRKVQYFEGLRHCAEGDEPQLGIYSLLQRFDLLKGVACHLPRD